MEKIIQINGTWALTNFGRIFERVEKFRSEQQGNTTSSGVGTHLVKDGYVWEEITLPGELQGPELDI